MRSVGVDEAGKGPVLGSMFVVAVAVDEADIEGLGVKDSKHLSSEKRQEIFEEVEESVPHSVIEVTPQEIDDKLRNDTMNDLMVGSHADVLRDLLDEIENHDYTTPVHDASDVSEDRFARRVSQEVGVDVRAEHGADEKYPAVSLASIIAKVKRDSHIESYGVGSGYPSDPKTIQFLQDYVNEKGKLPELARKSWKTSKRVLDEVSQESLEEFI